MHLRSILVEKYLFVNFFIQPRCPTRMNTKKIPQQIPWDFFFFMINNHHLK